MKVFEDLIEELRDENLLEETIIDLQRTRAKTVANGTPHSRALSAEATNAVSVVNNVAEISALESEYESHSHSDSDSDADSDSDSDSDPLGAREENESDFYRKRAMDEISSLQMVEHVLSGIEREQMKIIPASYDDLQAKKALHNFLQVQGDATTTEYAEAEFHLMRETETWSSALSARDHKISVANLRRFCENSRPVLSSQALLAIARFYRNSAFSELTRAKFDFVMTRLFSRETEGAKRRVLFGRAEMTGHIKTLYATWASIALYSAEDMPVKARAIVAGFEDRVAEVESALTFDQLIQNDFFKKIREFKETTGEIFFTPEVIAATIDCNTKVGNKFVDLIRLERERTDPESVEQKYGYEYDQAISDAAGKTIELADVLKHLPESEDEDGFDSAEFENSQDLNRPIISREAKEEKAPLFTFELFAVNKWLLLVTIVVLVVSSGLYFWSNQSSQASSAAVSAQDVNLENSELKEYMHSGRATSETFYAITLPAWDQLEEKKKREILQTTLEFANTNGQKFVQLMNARGRSVGFASNTKAEIYNP